MSVYQDIINAIDTAVGATTNVSKHYAYERWSNEWDKYLNQWKATINGKQRICGFVTTLNPDNPIQGAESDPEPYAEGHVSRVYNVRVFGIMDLKDSDNTEGLFLGIMESILDSLDGHVDWGLSADGVVPFATGPASLVRYDHRMFGNVLCHYCEISYPVYIQKVLVWQ